MTTAYLGASTRTRLRMTAKGRRFVVGMVTLPLAVVVFFGVLSSGDALASRVGAPAADQFTTVVVEHGQSLWSIARGLAPQADPRDVVDEIVRLNALGTSSVNAGQRIAVPSDIGS